MSEEWSELVWIGISLIIMAVILSLAFTFANLGKDMQAGLYEDQANVAKLQEIRSYAPYDGKQVSGSEMIAAMVDFSSKGVVVCAQIGGGSSFGMYGANSSLDTVKDFIADLDGNSVACPADADLFSSTEITTTALIQLANQYAFAKAGVNGPTVAVHQFNGKVFTDSAGNLLAIMFEGVEIGA